MWMVAPMLRNGMNQLCIPAEWYSGMHSTSTSDSLMSKATTFEAICIAIDPCVIIEPFGRDVVPDV